RRGRERQARQLVHVLGDVRARVADLRLGLVLRGLPAGGEADGGGGEQQQQDEWALHGNGLLCRGAAGRSGTTATVPVRRPPGQSGGPVSRGGRDPLSVGGRTPWRGAPPGGTVTRAGTPMKRCAPVATARSGHAEARR